jgi:hypothetical protein
MKKILGWTNPRGGGGQLTRNFSKEYLMHNRIEVFWYISCLCHGRNVAKSVAEGFAKTPVQETGSWRTR